MDKSSGIKKITNNNDLENKNSYGVINSSSGIKNKRTFINKLKLFFICLGSLICLIFAALMCISGIFIKPVYLKPWERSYAESFEEPRVRLAALGLLAANGHNMQPWKIKLDKSDDNVFYLYADSNRVTGEVDPYARQMMVSQGTFLEYAAIAGEQFGYKTNIELYPEGNYNESKLIESMQNIPVAKITITKTNPVNNKLYDTLFLPDTNRSAYQKDKLSADEIKKLSEINSDPSLSLEFYTDDENIKKIGKIAMDGIVIEAGVDRVMKESGVIFRPNEYVKNKYRYGFSVEGQGTTGIMKHIMQGMVTLFPSMNQGKAAADLFVQAGQVSIDHTPSYILIKSRDNSRINQIKSGMLYSRLIAAAHNLGLVMQPLSQVLEEYPEMEKDYTEINNSYAGDGGTIQMLVRIGKPAKEAPLSMRRDVMDIISK
ncbi:MAG: hypothetical protein WCD89_05985 [Anaerocolumna sp.]